MESQKLEDLLLLSLNSTQQERRESEELGVGYNEEDGRWELIIKYHGSAEGLLAENVLVEILLNGYAIISIPENKIAEYIQKPQVEYVEMPKRIFANVLDGRRESCIPEVTEREPFLRGKDVLVGIIDSGIDIFHEEFRNEEGNSRILGLWDQTGFPSPDMGLSPPEGFAYGIYYTQDMLNAILQGQDSGAPVPTDYSGHGTAVASIAAGSRIGVAKESSILMVKMGASLRESFPRTTQLMRAVQFLVTMAQKLEKPIAINISFGNCYGDHQGSSLVERFLDNASEAGRNVICVGSGNEAASNGHIQANIENEGMLTLELSIGEYETSLSMQLWKHYQDVLRVELISPEGSSMELRENVYGVRRETLGDTRMLCFAGQPTPYSVMQEYYFDFTPVRQYISSGIWRIRIEAVSIKNGRFNLYLPSYSIRSSNTGFYDAVPYGSFTIPSTAGSVITVGAYNPILRSYADFSGRGFTENREVYGSYNKPDLTAPGVEVLGARQGGGYGSFTGTSFSTPYVTGSCALLMDWGIIRGNDPYLYGQKCKAYLIHGAVQLPSEIKMPNASTGWGALCLEKSIPEAELVL